MAFTHCLSTGAAHLTHVRVLGAMMQQDTHANLLPFCAPAPSQFAAHKCVYSASCNDCIANHAP
jgi:hypothetical protein